MILPVRVDTLTWFPSSSYLQTIFVAFLKIQQQNYFDMEILIILEKKISILSPIYRVFFLNVHARFIS